jgi:hypothetical protein
MEYKMKIYGSFTGLKSGKLYHFDKGELIDAPEGEFDDSVSDFVKIKKQKIGKSKLNVLQKNG